MNYLSLFSGIGGMDLGLDRAGMRCVGQVEIDPFCRRVLGKHWPNVPRFEDVRTFIKDLISERIDLIAGGFPCVDISNAGQRAGIEAERSGLWCEMFRIICEVRPQFILVENVAALLQRGIRTVLRDLAISGHDAEWRSMRASQFGAPHLRDRLFIFGHRRDGGRSMPSLGNILADPGDESRWIQRPLRSSNQAELLEGCAHVAADGRASFYHEGEIHTGIGAWESEPGIGRVVHGIPNWMDRRSRLGNAVVPQVAEWIGRHIMEAAISSPLRPRLAVDANGSREGLTRVAKEGEK